MEKDLWHVLAEEFGEEKADECVDVLAREDITRLEHVKDVTLDDLRHLVSLRVARVLMRSARSSASLQQSRAAYFESEDYRRLTSRCTSVLVKQANTYTMEEPPPLLYYRPDTALPIALVCSVFGEFMDLCEDPAIVMTRKDTAFVDEFCSKSSEEDNRCTMLIGILRDYFPVGFMVDKIGNKVIGIYYAGQLLAIVEVRNGEGQAGSAYYVDQARRNRDAIMLRCERYPVFLLEITGALLKVSGAAFTSCPLVEPLKTGLLLRRPNRREMAGICRVMIALRQSLVKLVSLQAELLAHPPRDLDLTVARLPYPLQGLYFSAAPITVLNPGKLYLVNLDARAPLPEEFERIKARGFSSVMVKFCQRYGGQIHDDWSSRGCAPQLFETVRLPGDWLMVLMQYMSDHQDLHQKAQVLSATSHEWQVISRLARDCLQRAQASALLGVHGDLRLDNLLVDKQLTHVLAVDFERAGIHGVDRYPVFMNHRDVLWPAGAVDNGLLMQSHDNELLTTQLERKPKRKYEWHNDRTLLPKKLALIAYEHDDETLFKSDGGGPNVL